MLVGLAMLLAPCQAVIRLKTTSKSQVSAAVQELERVELEDARFWNSEWSAMEDEVLKLEKGLADWKQFLDSAPTGNSTRALLKSVNLNPKSVADLAPALAMLKGLYEDGKERIGKLNAREKESKEKFDAKEKEHNARIAKIEARFKNHSLSAEFRTNETRDETRLWNYWERCRERQHRQYRTGLKIQHATMDKVKKMIDMYEKTMSGKGNAADVQKALKKIAPPEIVFLQETQRSVARFCQTTRAELKEARAEAVQMQLQLHRAHALGNGVGNW